MSTVRTTAAFVEDVMDSAEMSTGLERVEVAVGLERIRLMV